MSLAYRFHTSLRKPEKSHLAFADKVFHRPGHILHRDVGINPVLVKQVDHIGPQAFKRSLGHLPDMFRVTVKSYPFRSSGRIQLKAEFRGNNDLFAEGCQRFAKQFLVYERSVDFRSVKKRDTTLNGHPQ